MGGFLSAAVGSSVTLNVVQSVAFAAPQSPVPYHPSAEGTGPRSVEASQGSTLVQQRLDKTSSTLEEALRAVERKLTLEHNTDG